MKKSRIAHIVCLLYVLAPFACMHAQQPKPEPVDLTYGSAVVTESKGAVSLHSAKGDVLPSLRGTVLQPGTVIATDHGSLLLTLGDSSQLLIKPHSRVVLKEPASSEGLSLMLLLGELLAKVRKRLENAPSFQMGTPTAAITVRGTQFSVEVTKRNKTVVQVFEGSVAVSAIGVQGPPVLVERGFMTEVEPDRPPKSPHHVGSGSPESQLDHERRSTEPGFAGDSRSDSGVGSTPESEQQGIPSGHIPTPNSPAEPASRSEHPDH
jgi:hypothetical protein